MGISALVTLGIGLGAAAILAVAARVFYVEIDPRITAVEDALPGANCGGCGYTGCAACAEAIVAFMWTDCICNLSISRKQMSEF